MYLAPSECFGTHFGTHFETPEPHRLREEQLPSRNSITVYDANQVLDNSRGDVTGMMNCQSNCADSHRTEQAKSEVGD